VDLHCCGPISGTEPRLSVDIRGPADAPTVRIQPLRNLIMVVALHEGDLGPTRSGLIVPKTAVFGQRWIGVVVGVGPDVDCVEWGDMLELSRWGEGQWHKWPAKELAGVATRTDTVQFDSGDGRLFMATGEQMWALMTPDVVGYRIATWDRLVGGRGQPAGVYPIADRILVRHLPKAEESEGGIIIPDYVRSYNPLADVVDVGSDVDDVAPGERVMLAGPNVGLHVKTRDGWMSVVRMKDVLMVVDGAEGEAEVTDLARFAPKGWVKP
jgi:co-chaperonin GroES (HSP10)